MDKWDYIRKISARGDEYGKHGGVLDLLDRTGKSSTQEITDDEARDFFTGSMPERVVASR